MKPIPTVLTALTGAVVAAAALTLAAVASASSSSTRNQTANNTQNALAYSRCMRSHGVPKFPDPSAGGVIPKVSLQQLGIILSVFQSAEKDCQRLLPTGTDDFFPPGEVEQLLIGMLRFSRCMRAHGVHNWPDPTTDSEGRPGFPLAEHGFTRQQARSPRIMRTENECGHALPSALGGVPIG
jgi:hypothetical protein